MYAVCCSLDWRLKLRVNTILRGILAVAYLLHLMLKTFKFSTPGAFNTINTVKLNGKKSKIHVDKALYNKKVLLYLLEVNSIQFFKSCLNLS